VGWGGEVRLKYAEAPRYNIPLTASCLKLDGVHP
jgi:hypothetical protein